MLALAEQNDGGAAAGFINPTIYAKKASNISDVTATFPNKGNVRGDYTNRENASGGYTYSVRTFATDSSLKVATGWDSVTGLGVPTTGFLSFLE